MKFNTFPIPRLGAFLAAMLLVGAAQAAPKAPKQPKPPKVPAHHLSFAKADIDASGSLTVYEFAKTQGPGTPMVEIRRRFLSIDTSGTFEVIIDPATGVQAIDPVTGQPVFGAAIPDGVITLAEWDAYLALRVKPTTTLTRFELADFDGDGKLTPVEFGYLASPRVPYKNTIRGFDKLDTNDDGFLSPEECTKTRAAGL